VRELLTSNKRYILSLKLGFLAFCCQPLECCGFILAVSCGTTLHSPIVRGWKLTMAGRALGGIFSFILFAGIHGASYNRCIIIVAVIIVM